MAWVDINNSEIAVGKPIKQTLFQRIKDNLDYLYTYNNVNNVTNAGTSTDNAIARFDGATGKIIQNSSVIIDDTGNISGAGTYNTYTINQSVGSSSSPTFVGLTLTAFSGVVKASTGVISASAILNADIDANAAIVDTKLATISTAGKVSNSATTATSANTISAIVARDSNGDFSARTVSLAGVAKVSDGSVSAPSYSFTNSTNTGFYYESSSLKATLAGDEKLAISANQRNYFGRSKTLTDNVTNSILDINVASNSSSTIIVSTSLTCIVGNVVKHASIDITCIVKNENGTISTNIRSTETQYSSPDIIITPTLVAGTAKATLNIFVDTTNNSTIDMYYECKYLGVTTNTITFL